jgi:hypothetical protein
MEVEPSSVSTRYGLSVFSYLSFGNRLRLNFSAPGVGTGGLDFGYQSFSGLSIRLTRFLLKDEAQGLFSWFPYGIDMGGPPADHRDPLCPFPCLLKDMVGQSISQPWPRLLQFVADIRARGIPDLGRAPIGGIQVIL